MSKLRNRLILVSYNYDANEICFVQRNISLTTPRHFQHGNVILSILLER